MWEILFSISVVINLISFFYIRWLLRTISAINQDVDQLSLLIYDFQNHLTSVHELEMFYGDDTLKALMQHAKKLSETLEDLDLILNEPEESDSVTEEVDSFEAS